MTKISNTKLTLLSFEQVYSRGIDKRLDVIKKNGNQAEVSELCVLLGSYFSCDDTPKCENISGNTWGIYLTKTLNELSNEIYAISSPNSYDTYERYTRRTSIRPVLQSTKIFEKILLENKNNNVVAEEVECGEYPQSVASLELQEILENEYQSRKLSLTKKSYTFDDTGLFDRYSFTPLSCPEYQYNDKKYVRIKSKKSIFDKFEFSNGKIYDLGSYVWIEVLPITWLVDYKSKLLVSKICLASGIIFLDIDHEYTGDFEQTKMYRFLNNYMLKEMSLTKKIKCTKYKTTENNHDNEIDNLYEKINEYLNRTNIKELNFVFNKIIEDYNNQFLDNFDSKQPQLLINKNNQSKDIFVIKMKELLAFLKENDNLFEILEYINELIKTFYYRENGYFEKDKFYIQFKKITSLCQKLDDDYKEKNINLCLNDLEKEKTKLEKYIVGIFNKEVINNKIEYQSLNEFKKYINKTGIFVKWLVSIKNDFAVAYIKNRVKIQNDISKKIDTSIDDYFIKRALFHFNTISMTINNISKTIDKLLIGCNKVNINNRCNPIINELSFLKSKARSYMNIDLDNLLQGKTKNNEYETIINYLLQVELELFRLEIEVDSKIRDINFFIKINENRKRAL